MSNRLNLLVVTAMVVVGVAAASDPALEAGRRAGRLHAVEAGKQYSYGFDNWSEPIGRLTWEDYARAYYNLELDYDRSTAWFDKLIYNTVASQLSGGFCFGMSLQSLTMNIIGGYRGFCCPTGAYKVSTYTENTYDAAGNFLRNYSGGPADERLRKVIKEMHCHQLTQACILTYIEQIDSRIARNGGRMLDYFEAALANETAVLANITKSVEPLSEGAIVAHSVVAYRVERTSRTKGKIYIVDPNRCWQYNTGADSVNHHGWYADGKNYIEIDGLKWRYVGSVSRDEPVEQWPVNDANPNDVSNGFLICVPATRVAPAGRSLASLGLAIGNVTAGVREVLEMMYISGKAVTLRQIDVPSGQRLINPVTGTYEEDPARRLPRVVPYFLASGVTPTQSTDRTFMFMSDRRHDSITYRCTTGPDGATMVMAGSGSFVTVKTATPNVDIDVTFRNLHTASPSIHCQSDRNAIVDIECTQMTPARWGRRMYLRDEAVTPTGRTIMIPMHTVRAVPGETLMSTP